MGFYGSLSSVNKSTFQFDKIYPNRYELDLNANTDSVFVGRYVLVDYDTNSTNTIEGVSFETIINAINHAIGGTSEWARRGLQVPSVIVPGYQERELRVKIPEEPVDDLDHAVPYSDTQLMYFVPSTVRDDAIFATDTKSHQYIIRAGIAPTDPVYGVTKEGESAKGTALEPGTFIGIYGYMYRLIFYTEEIVLDDEGMAVWEDGHVKTEDKFYRELYLLTDDEKDVFENPRTIFSVGRTFYNEVVNDIDEETGEPVVDDQGNPVTHLSEDIYVPSYSYITDLTEDMLQEESDEARTYHNNYIIDCLKYNVRSRGWDSTVWQKVFLNGEYAYKMIAELNSVVPTFDVTVDAPTPLPIPPYYDSDTSNIYYKLHVQPSWGVRVRAAEPLELESSNYEVKYPSDIKDSYVKGLTANGRENLPSEQRDLAIYFNKEGFSKYIDKEPDFEDDTILFQPTGKGYRNYYGDGSKNKVDTYELTMMLPSLGTSVADMWDIVYGDSSGNKQEWDAEKGLLPGYVHSFGENRFLWDKKTGIFSDLPLRNTNIAWNNYNGIRPFRNGEYDYSRLKSLAANINYAHDLFGMIIREGESFDNVANWDPTKIYLINNKFYRKAKKYTYTNLASADIPSALSSSDYVSAGPLINVADGTYWKKVPMQMETFEDDELDNNESLGQTSKKLYYNYIKVGVDETPVDGVEYGKVSNTSNQIENVTLSETGYIPGTFYKYRVVNGVEQYELDNAPSPTGSGQYYTIKPMNPGDKKFYNRYEYCIGIKYKDSEGFDQELWDAKETFNTEDFDKLQSCTEEPLYSELISRLDDENAVYKFFNIDDWVTTISVPSAWVEDKNNPKFRENIDITPLFYETYTYDSATQEYVATYTRTFGEDEDAVTVTEEERIPRGFFTFNNENQPVKYKAYLYLTEDNQNLLTGGHTLLELISDSSYIPVIQEGKLRKVYNGEMKGDQTLIILNDDAEPTELRGIEENQYYYWNPSELGQNQKPWDIYPSTRVSTYFLETPENFDRQQSDIRAEKNVYCTLEIVDAPVFYIIDEGYYYNYTLNGHDDWIKETVTKIKPVKSAEDYKQLYPDKSDGILEQMAQKDSARLTCYYQFIENSEEHEGKKWTPEVNKIFYPNKYYKKVDGEYLLANTYEAGVEYYTKNDIYVNTCAYNFFDHGAIWNKSINPTTANVTLANRSEYWGAEEIKGFAESDGTMHGLLLAANNLLLAGDRETRDRTTVQGALNVLNDYLNRFSELKVQEFVTIDEYGRIHSATWDTEQDDIVTNYGQKNNGDYVTSDEVEDVNNRWIDLELDPDKDQPHFTINHTFKKIADTTTTSDKNGGTISGTSGLNNSTSDTIDLYTPLVDAQGHIVGHNIETVTLPYNYKTIAIGEQSTEDYASAGSNTPSIAAGTTIDKSYSASGNLVADNTKDTLTINTGNKWIRLKAVNDGDNDSYLISHEVHSINTANNPLTDLNDLVEGDINNTITIPDWNYDNAGHITEKHNHTYTLPFGFKTITTNGRLNTNTGGGNTESISAQDNIVADNTQDTLAIDSGNDWIRILTNANNDRLIICHDVKSTSTSTSTQNLSTETSGTTTFDVPSYSFDDMNHYSSRNTKTITMPNSYGKFTGDSGSSEATATHDTFAINGDSWIQTTASADKIAFAHIGPVSTVHTAINNVSPAFGSSFTIVDWTFDAKGHKANSGTHTVTIPKGSLTVNEGINNAKVITDLTFTDTTGALIAKNKDVGELALTGLTTSSSISTMPTATDSINTAISKLAYVLDNDKTQVNTRITDAINNLDATETQTAGTDGLALSITQTNGVITNISGSIAANTYDAYGAASAAEQNAINAFSTATFTYTTAPTPNPEYDPEDPESEEFLPGESTTKTIEEWIAYFMERM